jgi:hypothetical protein
MAVCELLVAPPGSGKSFSIVHYIVDDWLLNDEGPVWSNLPLRVDNICEYLKKRGKDPEKLRVRERLREIPPETIKSWIDDTQSEASGPWEFFQEVDGEQEPDKLTGAFVVIDECHNFVTSKSHPKHKKKWSDWLGEIRHREAVIRFISQHEMKVATVIRNHCAVFRNLVSGDVRRDPFFGIQMGDWYELKAKISGEWNPVVFEIETADIGGKRKETNQRRFTLGEPYYSLYNSYSQAEGSKGKGSDSSKGGKKTKQKFQQLSWPALLWWFVSRNFGALFGRLALVAVVGFVLLNPGWFLTLIVDSFKVVTPTSSAAEPEKVSSVIEETPVKDGENESPAIEEPGTEDEFNQVKAALARVEELQSQIEQIVTEQQSLGRLQGLTPTRVIYQGGLTFRIGDKMDRGIYRGHSITRIDVTAGYYQLNDDQRTRVWLQNSWGER